MQTHSSDQRRSKGQRIGPMAAKATRVSLIALAAVVGQGFTEAQAQTIVPTDLNPGDQYRLAFVSSTTRNATSNNIADYNSFVDGLGDTAIASDWRAIVSSHPPIST